MLYLKKIFHQVSSPVALLITSFIPSAIAQVFWGKSANQDIYALGFEESAKPLFPISYFDIFSKLNLTEIPVDSSLVTNTIASQCQRLLSTKARWTLVQCDLSIPENQPPNASTIFTILQSLNESGFQDPCLNNHNDFSYLTYAIIITAALSTLGFTIGAIRQLCCINQLQQQPEQNQNLGPVP